MAPAPAYDEFGLFHENAEEFGIEMPAPPEVGRVSADVGGGSQLSALRWGHDRVVEATVRGFRQHLTAGG